MLPKLSTYYGNLKLSLGSFLVQAGRFSKYDLTELHKFMNKFTNSHNSTQQDLDLQYG